MANREVTLTRRHSLSEDLVQTIKDSLTAYPHNTFRIITQIPEEDMKALFFGIYTVRPFKDGFMISRSSNIDKTTT